MAVSDVFRAIRAVHVTQPPEEEGGVELPLLGSVRDVVLAAKADGVVDVEESAALRHLLGTTRQTVGDREALLTALGTPELMLRMPAQKHARDKAGALAAVTKQPLLYCDLPESLRSDKDIALAAVTRRPHLVHELPASLEGDVDLGLAALSDPNRSLRTMPDKMRAQPRLRREALMQLFPAGLPEAMRSLLPDALAAVAGDIDFGQLPGRLAANPTFIAFLCMCDRKQMDTAPRAPLTNVEMWVAWASIDPKVAQLRIIKELQALTPVERASLSSELRDAKITHVERFATLDALRRVLRDNSKADDRPLAVLVYPRWDHNGAFTAWVNIPALQRHHRVIYREVESDREFEQAVGTDYGKRANLLLIGGHGQQTSTEFGAGNGQVSSNTLDYGDVPRLRRLNLADRMANGSKVVLFSCSTGQGANNARNIANLVAGLFPCSTTYAPTGPAGPAIQMSDDGLITDVRFPGVSAYVVPPTIQME